MKRIGKIVRPPRLTLDEMRTRFRIIPEAYQDQYRGGCEYCVEWEREGKHVFMPEEWWQIMDSGETWPGGWVCGRRFIPADAVYNGVLGSYCHFHENYFVDDGGSCLYCLIGAPVEGGFASTYNDIMNPDYFKGYGQAGYVSCWDSCVNILKRYNITNPGGPDGVYQLMWEDGGDLVPYYYSGDMHQNYSRALACIDRHLNAGRPIIVGVNHEKRYGINEGATDHFIVITGKGYDPANQRYYYTYVDPGRSDASNGCDMENNRLYYNSDTNEFFDSEGGFDKKRFDVTQVRPNDGLYPGETIKQPKRV